MTTDSTVFLSTAVLKATVVFGISFVGALALRRASSSARYLLWTGALAAALMLPLLSLAVRPWNVPLAAPAAVMAQIGPVEPAAAAPGLPVSDPAPASHFRWLIPIWLCGAGGVLARILIGNARVRWVVRRAAAVRDPAWTSLLAETGARLGLRRRVDLRRSADADVPLSYGLLRPVVLLPAGSEEWSAERRGVVLLHELIHIRRRDWLAGLMAQLCCAAYWFHPLAWLAAARLRREQERSCDDAVIMAGMRQSAYAEHLVELARSLSEARSRWTAALSMADRAGLEHRVQALLDPRCKRRVLSGRLCLAALSAAAVCVIPFAALRAQEAGPKASLAGSVLDASGGAVPNATVLLKNANGKNQEITRADAAGEFKFAAIAPGRYDLEVRARGFAPYQHAGLTLAAGGQVRQDARLELGSVNETIDVVAKGPRPAAPAATGAPRRIRVGGNVQATKLLRMAKPVYPPGALAAGVEGTVLLRAVISTSGNLLGLTVLNTSVDAELAQAAMDAVKQWQYQPTLLNGAPVEVVTTITVNFRLEH